MRPRTQGLRLGGVSGSLSQSHFPACPPTRPALSPWPAVQVPETCRAPLEDLLRAIRGRLPVLQAVHDCAPPAEAGRGGSAASGPPESSSSDPPTHAHGRLAQAQYHLSLSRTAPVRLQQVGGWAAGGVLHALMRAGDRLR